MNVMQYLMQQTDEFRDSYQQMDLKIDERLSKILDKLDVLEIRLQEIEFRMNNNQNDSNN